MKNKVEIDSLNSLLKDKLFYDELLSSVKADFAKRQESRRSYELSWQLNMNFLMGNQYCNISGKGEIEQEDKFFFWQEREVYNHIAPIMETRIAKLNRVRPILNVRPFSNSDSDLYSAKVSLKVLNSTSDRLNLDKAISNATLWSEVCGTSFYKLSWDKTKGKCVGKLDNNVYEGDISLSVCPPFEIYPEGNAYTSLEECNSIIHAKAYSISDIKRIFGAEVLGEEVRIYALNGTMGIGGLGYNSTVPSITQEVKNDHVVVIEKYVRPDDNHPNGQLIIVAGDKILEYTSLPYVNGEEGARDFPFIRQVSAEQTGCFWGMSVIERIIPVQRSYNAVKNRKHEFLNRIAMGVLTVEDGSIDTDNLEEEGLSPGKVLIYRQGSTPPRMLDAGRVPTDFQYEEDRLLNEFVMISGVSELMRNSATPTNVTSGIALQLLIEQDDSRLSATSEEIRRAIKTVAKHMLRLYRQFAIGSRLMKTVGEGNEIEIYYFSSNEISSDDVVLDTENEMNNSIASKRAFIMELLASGLLHDENGRINQSNKVKILDMLGFGNWNDAQDVSQLHLKRAAEENIEGKKLTAYEIDDHNIHIEEHTKFIISGQANKESKSCFDNLMKHIDEHIEIKTQLTLRNGVLAKQISAE